MTRTLIALRGVCDKKNVMAKDFLISRDHVPVIAWLLVCMALVAGMVALGGYTRLSGSGLSITEWKPIHGVFPPANDQEWEEEFAAYKESPQFQKENSDMTVETFKDIYWPEYFHRLLGRAIGVVVLIPFIIFIIRGSLARSVMMHVGGIFLLGALQGFIGWFMVQSGLIDNPRVSHVRLALHLALAFAIFGLLQWLWLDVMKEHFWWKEEDHSKAARPGGDPLSFFVVWFFLLCLQILFGAFMAGLHAGFVYNSWPTMNGVWVPDLSGDVELIQFIHRWLAALVVGGFFVWWAMYREYVINIRLEVACLMMGVLLAVQFYLGVLTLINVVPLDLALSHQLCALALFAGGIFILHQLVVEAKDG
jgi:cytochrome c oxidase assembly protein subunit 15